MGLFTVKDWNALLIFTRFHMKCFTLGPHLAQKRSGASEAEGFNLL
jgi:hypothetical protein